MKVYKLSPLLIPANHSGQPVQCHPGLQPPVLQQRPQAQRVPKERTTWSSDRNLAQEQGGRDWIAEAVARAAAAARRAAEDAVTAVGRAALIVQPAPWTVDRAQVNVGAVACAADLLYGDLPVTRRLVTDIDAVGCAWIDSDDDGFY